MNLSRRGFIGGLGLAIAAPAIVKAASIMPVSSRALFVPQAILDLDGGLYKIADYPELFAVVRNWYGGDGVKTFRLPDYRGPQGHAIMGDMVSERYIQMKPRIVTGAAPLIQGGIPVPAGLLFDAPDYADFPAYVSGN